MKKLITSICMLCLAAAMFGTSTFAWFSMNTSVSASGMQIKATTNANLYIKDGIITAADSISEIAVNMDTTQHSLKPADLTYSVDTVTVRVPATYTTAPTVGSAGVGETWTEKGSFKASTETAALNSKDSDGIGNYIAGQTMTLVRKAETNDKKSNITAKVTVTLTGTSSNLNKALRCGFLVGTNWTESGDATVNGGKIEWNFNNLIQNLQDNTVQALSFVIWYEGEDTDCFTNNAIILTANSVAIVFTSADAAA